VNWGAIRTFAHRAAPIYQLLVLSLIGLGFNGFWLILAGIVGVIIYIIVDYKIMFSQEQELYWRKNPEYRKLNEKIDKILEAMVCTDSDSTIRDI